MMKEKNLLMNLKLKVLNKVILFFILSINPCVAQNLLFDKDEKPEFGIETGALNDKSTHISIGASLFKIRANEWAYYVSKISTGIEIGLFKDKTIYHYIEYTRTAWILQYGFRFNQYKMANYRVSLIPYLGVSFFGKYNLFAGYVFTNDKVQDNRFMFGFNSIFSFTKGFKNL